MLARLSSDDDGDAESSGIYNDREVSSVFYKIYLHASFHVASQTDFALSHDRQMLSRMIRRRAHLMLGRISPG